MEIVLPNPLIKLYDSSHRSLKNYFFPHHKTTQDISRCPWDSHRHRRIQVFLAQAKPGGAPGQPLGASFSHQWAAFSFQTPTLWSPAAEQCWVWAQEQSPTLTHAKSLVPGCKFACFCHGMSAALPLWGWLQPTGATDVTSPAGGLPDCWTSVSLRCREAPVCHYEEGSVKG